MTGINHCFTERLSYLGQSLLKDMVWRGKASNTFPHLKSDSKAESKASFSANAMRPFTTFLGPVTFLRLKRNCIRS